MMFCSMLVFGVLGCLRSSIGVNSNSGIFCISAVLKQDMLRRRLTKGALLISIVYSLTV